MNEVYAVLRRSAVALAIFGVSAAPAFATTIERVVSAGGIEAWLVHEPAVPLIAVDFAFAGGAVQVTNLDGGLYQETPNLPVIGTSFVFDVNGGVDEPAGVNGPGSAAAPLEIQLSAPAQIAGIATGSIDINSVGTPTEGALTLAQLPSLKGNIAGLELMIHVGGQPIGHIPVFRLREDPIATAQLNSAVPYRLGRADSQLLPL